MLVEFLKSPGMLLSFRLNRTAEREISLNEDTGYTVSSATSLLYPTKNALLFTRSFLVSNPFANFSLWNDKYRVSGRRPPARPAPALCPDRTDKGTGLGAVRLLHEVG